VPGDKGDIKFFRLVFVLFFILYKFVLFERLSVSLKWILSLIFVCCCTVMPCRTLCHSELSVDHHFLKFHGRFFLFILLAAAGSVSPVSPLYLISLPRRSVFDIASICYPFTPQIA
jgi:hypothetical protein